MGRIYSIHAYATPAATASLRTVLTIDKDTTSDITRDSGNLAATLPRSRLFAVGVRLSPTAAQRVFDGAGMVAAVDAERRFNLGIQVNSRIVYGPVNFTALPGVGGVIRGSPTATIGDIQRTDSDLVAPAPMVDIDNNDKISFFVDTGTTAPIATPLFVIALLETIE